MTDMGLTLAWLAIQVTAVAVTGAALAAWAGRRGPATAAPVTAGTLAAVLMLAPLAVLPLPTWWTWPLPTDPAPAIASAPWPSAPAASPQVVGDGPSFAWPQWLRLGGPVASPAEAPVQPRWHWPGLLTSAVLIGAALGLARLGLGLWAVHSCRRRARPIADPELVQLMDELRPALGCRRTVAAWESHEIATAATVGCSRPVVLLSANWRSWSDTEQRAVLAHELAHVAAHDFGAWVAARIALAVYFFHPLVHWLVGRLRLQQELAADARAAPLVGGRTVYLQALARLALAADDRLVGGLAPAFLSRKGTLLRRMAMLRVMDDWPRPARRWRWRSGMVLALVATASALRAPVREAIAEPSESKNTAPASTAGPAPFDLSLVVPSAKANEYGVYAVRPAAVLTRPELQPLAQSLNRLANEQFPDLMGKARPGLTLGAIEQVLGRVQLAGGTKPGTRTVQLSLTAIRLTHDFDWPGQLRTWFPKMTECRHRDRTYYRAKGGPLAAIAPGDAFFFVADRRTLVWDSEAAIHRLIDAQVDDRPIPQPGYAADWKSVARGLAAVALDNRDQKLLLRATTAEERVKYLAAPGSLDGATVRTLLAAPALVAGCDGGDTFRFQLRARCTSAVAAARLEEDYRACLAPAPDAPVKSSADGDAATLLNFQGALRKGLTWRRNGSVVEVRAEVRPGVNQLLKLIPLEEKAK